MCVCGGGGGGVTILLRLKESTIQVMNGSSHVVFNLSDSALA